MHAAPQGDFFERRGSYSVKCRNEPVPRFRCRTCQRGFSYQTFRVDYRDHRPHDNARLFRLLTSGVSLRQSGRLLEMNVGVVQRKFRKLGRAMRRLNRNLLGALPPNRVLLMDEFETYENSRVCPMTVPVVIDGESRLVLAFGAGPIRRSGTKGSARQCWLERFERKHGRRKDKSRLCVQVVLRRCRRLLGGTPATLLTDEKPLYASLVRRVFPATLTHRTISGERPRATWNPLFPINHTEAMLRDNCGRLRRRSWLVSKKAQFLRCHLHLFAAYRNWHRPRANHEDNAPGVLVRLINRNLTVDELLAWRQDWRSHSPHPTFRGLAAA